MKINANQLSEYAANSIDGIAESFLTKFEAKSGLQALAINPLIDPENLVAIFIQQSTFTAEVFSAIAADYKIDGLAQAARTIEAGQDPNVRGRANSSPSIGVNLPPDHMEIPVYHYPMIWPFYIIKSGQIVRPANIEGFMKKQADFAAQDLENRLPNYAEIEVIRVGH